MIQCILIIIPCRIIHKLLVYQFLYQSFWMLQFSHLIIHLFQILSLNPPILQYQHVKDFLYRLCVSFMEVFVIFLDNFYILIRFRIYKILTIQLLMQIIIVWWIIYKSSLINIIIFYLVFGHYLVLW